MLSVIMLNVVMHSVMHILSDAIMPVIASVVTLTVVMHSVIMLNALLSVMQLSP